MKIESFRSIVDQTLVLSANCLGLIGLNESGKSNILCAIRTLNSSYKLKKSDRSKITNTKPCITFKFDINDKEKLEIKENLEKWLADNTQVTFEDLFPRQSNFAPAFTKVQSLNEKFEMSSVERTTFGSVNCSDLLFAAKFQGNETVELEYGNETVTVGAARIIRQSLAKRLPDGIYINLSDFYINVYLKEAITKVAKRYMPRVTYWEFDTKHLIPSEITYDELLAADEIEDFSVPLYNVFYICEELKIEDDDQIFKTIKEWRQDSGKRRKDSDLINLSVNNHIKKVWPDYSQEISISLEETKMTVHFKDPLSPIKNYYEMVERSQGFKTFISFILTMAIDAEWNPNHILVLDEPETHLHPSGVRFMRDELYKLAAKGNQVVFATHSIFMANRKELDKHIIVVKEHEKTLLQPVTRNNLIQESVIYEALGTTVDEFSIKPFNIVFEGTIDRYIFDFYCNQCLNRKNNKALKYELLDGGGTNLITRFFHDKCIPRDSFWALVLDNDKAADNLIESLKKNFGKYFDTSFKVFRYSNIKDFELEDVLPIDIVTEAFKNAAEKHQVHQLAEITFNEQKPFSGQVKEAYSRATLSKIEADNIEGSFKEVLFEKVKLVIEQEISKESKAAGKNESFKLRFSEYHDFVLSVLSALP